MSSAMDTSPDDQLVKMCKEKKWLEVNQDLRKIVDKVARAKLQTELAQNHGLVVMSNEDILNELFDRLCSTKKWKQNRTEILGLLDKLPPDMRTKMETRLQNIYAWFDDAGREPSTETSDFGIQTRANKRARHNVSFVPAAEVQGASQELIDSEISAICDDDNWRNPESTGRLLELYHQRGLTQEKIEQIETALQEKFKRPRTSLIDNWRSHIDRACRTGKTTIVNKFLTSFKGDKEVETQRIRNTHLWIGSPLRPMSRVLVNLCSNGDWRNPENTKKIKAELDALDLSLREEAEKLLFLTFQRPCTSAEDVLMADTNNNQKKKEIVSDGGDNLKVAFVNGKYQIPHRAFAEFLLLNASACMEETEYENESGNERSAVRERDQKRKSAATKTPLNVGISSNPAEFGRPPIGKPPRAKYEPVELPKKAMSEDGIPHILTKEDFENKFGESAHSEDMAHDAKKRRAKHEENFPRHTAVISERERDLRDLATLNQSLGIMNPALDRPDIDTLNYSAISYIVKQLPARHLQRSITSIPLPSPEQFLLKKTAAAATGEGSGFGSGPDSKSTALIVHGQDTTMALASTYESKSIPTGATATSQHRARELSMLEQIDAGYEREFMCTKKFLHVPGLDHPVLLRKCSRHPNCVAQSLAGAPPGLAFREYWSPTLNEHIKTNGILTEKPLPCLACLKHQQLEHYQHWNLHGVPPPDCFSLQMFCNPVDVDGGFHSRFCFLPAPGKFPGFSNKWCMFIIDKIKLLYDPGTGEYYADQSRMEYNSKPDVTPAYRSDDLLLMRTRPDFQ